MFTCARICVEVDLEKGLPEAIKLALDGWMHVQQLDYKQIPFKCRSCHEYNHFIKNCPKNPQGVNVEFEDQEGEWKLVKKKPIMGEMWKIIGPSNPTRPSEPKAPQHKILRKIR
jgi:hypothetical protein